MVACVSRVGVYSAQRRKCDGAQLTSVLRVLAMFGSPTASKIEHLAVPKRIRAKADWLRRTSFQTMQFACCLGSLGLRSHFGRKHMEKVHGRNETFVCPIKKRSVEVITIASHCTNGANDKFASLSRHSTFVKWFGNKSDRYYGRMVAHTTMARTTKHKANGHILWSQSLDSYSCLGFCYQRIIKKSIRIDGWLAKVWCIVDVRISQGCGRVKIDS